MNQLIKKSFQFLAISSLVSSSGFAQKFACQSEALTYLDNATFFISAQMSANNILEQIVFQLDSNVASALKIQGPVTGVKSKSVKMLNVNRFDISDSKSDKIDLYLPMNPATPNFKASIRVSFDGGYPLEKTLDCKFVQNLF